MKKNKHRRLILLLTHFSNPSLSTCKHEVHNLWTLFDFVSRRGYEPMRSCGACPGSSDFFPSKPLSLCYRLWSFKHPSQIAQGTHTHTHTMRDTYTPNTASQHQQTLKSSDGGALYFSPLSGPAISRQPGGIAGCLWGRFAVPCTRAGLSDEGRLPLCAPLLSFILK